MRIGSVELPLGLILAPMAGVSDLPFRLLCREQGCELAVTEMISAKAVWYKNRGTADLLRTVEEDRPLAVQLFGSDPEICGEIAGRLSEGPWDLIDFNMGCPVPKVVNNGEGSALMKDPKKAAEVVRAMVQHSKLPVTVKIRAGFERANRNAVEAAKYLEDAGAAAIAVHGRTREEYYSGRADREIIRAVKEAVSVPVIGNGDITSASEALDMFNRTGCDGIMVGRGAEGNPWIFAEIREALLERAGNAAATEGGGCEAAGCGGAEGGNASANAGIGRGCKAGEAGIGRFHAPTGEEKLALILRHLDMQVKQDGPKMGILKMRSHIAWYLKGIPNAAAIRNRVNTADSRELLEEILRGAFL